jgi:glycyl-tRNA synthetase beta chain
MSTRNLIFEIGTEELPAAYLDIAIDALSFKQGSAISALFESYNVKFDKAYAHAAPRRLILNIKDIPLTQDITIEGPPARIAYGADKTPTRALEAFLKKNNAALKDIVLLEAGKEERVAIKKSDMPNADILSELLPKAAGMVIFPKAMRWDDSGSVFARPIRWLLAVFGDQVIRFNFAGIYSSNTTRGHRFLGRNLIKIKNEKDYFKALSREDVIWDRDERRKKITAFLEKRRWHKNQELLDEVSNLVESPFPIEGIFKQEYLKIPKEVLLASMSKHQRIFCLQDKRGNLINRFAGILNGNYKNKKQIVKNFENVLDARLKDALFFYKTDTKMPLSKWAEGLDGLIFHKELGTVADKILRLKKIAQLLIDETCSSACKKTLQRAVSLCKADLLTAMVKEFPSLQGVIGMYYAADSGESKDVSQAIGEHYLPRFADDEIPQSELGALLSLTDKLDNIMCYFKIGKFPKGSNDLYALRRQGIGIISVLIKKGIRLSIDEVFDAAYEICPGDFQKNKLENIFMDFFRDRFVFFVRARFSYRHDLIESVVTDGFKDIYKTYLKLQALDSIINEIYFERARVIVERTHNIIRASKDAPSNVLESLLSEPQEIEVYRKFKKIQAEFKRHCAEGGYAAATEAFSDALYDCVHDFFDKVMVNVPERKIRINRISLLSEINRLYTYNIADLSKIVSKQKKEE